MEKPYYHLETRCNLKDSLRSPCDSRTSDVENNCSQLAHSFELFWVYTIGHLALGCFSMVQPICDYLVGKVGTWGQYWSTPGTTLSLFCYFRIILGNWELVVLTCFDVFVLCWFYCVLSCDSDKLLFEDELCELYFYLKSFSCFESVFPEEYLDPWAEWECQRSDSFLSLPFSPLPTSQRKLDFGTSASCIRDVSDCFYLSKSLLLTKCFYFKVPNIS